MLDALPLTVQVLFVLVPLTFVALGLPLRLRKVRPNVWYGFRTRATLSDEALWYEVNARTGTDLVGSGVLLTLVGVIGASAHGNCRVGCVGLWLAGLLASCAFMLAHGLLYIREHERGRPR